MELKFGAVHNFGAHSKCRDINKNVIELFQEIVMWISHQDDVI